MECRTVTIRYGDEKDLAHVGEIYNHYIATSTATFDVAPWTTERRDAWMGQFAQHGPHRLVIADLEGLVVGFANSSPMNEKSAYDTSVKTEVFIAPAFCGRGLGRRLYDTLFDKLRDEDLHCAYAEIALPNEASTNLHQSVGFEKTGLFREAGRKFGRYWDVLWLARRMP